MIVEHFLLSPLHAALTRCLGDARHAIERPPVCHCEAHGKPHMADVSLKCSRVRFVKRQWEERLKGGAVNNIHEALEFLEKSLEAEAMGSDNGFSTQHLNGVGRVACWTKTHHGRLYTYWKINGRRISRRDLAAIVLMHSRPDVPVERTSWDGTGG